MLSFLESFLGRDSASFRFDNKAQQNFDHLFVFDSRLFPCLC